jgi:hypothetical protein
MCQSKRRNGIVLSQPCEKHCVTGSTIAKAPKEGGKKNTNGIEGTFKNRMHRV